MDSGDLYQDYATLLADVQALLQSYQQTGGRLLPMGPLAGLPAEEAGRLAEAPRRPVEPLRRPIEKQGEPTRRPVEPAVESLRRPLETPAEPRGVRPEPKAEAEPLRPAAGWTRYLKDTAEELRRHQTEEIGDCRRCGRCEGRNFLFSGIGSPKADLVVICNSPTEEEEFHQQLLMGPAGEMFDNMLAKVLLTSREKIYLLPALLCRGKGKLNPVDVAACLPLIAKQVELIKPKVVLLMGTEALALLGPEARRGEWAMMGSVEVMPTWHPAEILADPSRKRATFQHLQLVQPRLGQMSLFGAR